MYTIYAAGSCRNRCGWSISIGDFKFLLPIIKFTNNVNYVFFCPQCNKEYIYDLNSSKFLFIFNNHKCEFRIDVHLYQMVDQKTQKFYCNLIPFNNLSSEEYLILIEKTKQLKAFI